MKWDYLFSTRVLRRGAEYYREKRVQGLTQTEGIYKAWVEGSEDYEVTIDLKNERRPRMTCTCPYAEDGNRCKHMAAVLYKIQEKADKNKESMAAEFASSVKARQEKKTDKQVYPFGQNPELLWEIGAEETPKYCYFDLGRITKDRPFYASEVAKAQALTEDKTVVLDALDTGYDQSLDAHNMVVHAYGFAKMRKVNWNVNIVFNRERILKLECKVPGCPCNKDYTFLRIQTAAQMHNYNREPICSHELALMLLTDQSLKANNPGDCTDLSARKMMDAFRLQRAAAESTENREIQGSALYFEPRLTVESTGLTVSFRTGTDKMYVVKNLTELVNTIEKKGVLELGTKERLDVSLHPIADSTKKYYDFIRNIVRIEQGRSSYADKLIARADIAETIRGTIPLYGRRLDDFFNTVKGSSVELNDRYSSNSKRRISFREKDPKAAIDIAPVIDEGNFIGIRAEGTVPKFLEGENYLYYIEEKYLNRMSQSAKERMEPLLAMADFYNRIHFEVGRKNLSEFYYRVLPILEECAQIEQDDREEILAYLPPEASFLFRLDAENSNVTCSAQALYGEQVWELMDWKTGNIQQADLRDEQLEKEVLHTIQHYFPAMNLSTKQFHCENNPDAIFELLENGLHHLMELGEVRTTERFRHIGIRKSTKVTIGISMESGLMNLEILSDDLSQEELLDILYHYERRKKYYRLKDGNFLSLEQENLMELSAMLDTMKISPREFVEGKMQLPAYRALYLNRMLEENDNLYVTRDSRFRKLVKEFKTVQECDFEVPDSLKPVMRNYQVYGYKWLRTLEGGGFGGILADDMGLGKTLQVIAVLLAHQIEHTGENHTSLVVCPASLVYNWKEEFSRFAPSLSVLTITGSQEERKEKIADWKDYQVLVTSYDLLKRDIAEYEGKTFCYQVIDEAQYIKNHTTAAAKAVKVIKSRARFALTGTPIENRLSELWSIFDFLMPGFLYGYETFKRDFETPIVKFQDQEAMKQLKRMAGPFILRRLKNDVLKDLPEKLEEVHYAQMNKEQMNLYNAQVAHMQQMLETQSSEEFNTGKLQILAELTKIRQICCDPSLLLENYRGESTKREACMELIQSAMEGEHKMLVFSQFTSMLELLENDLKKEKISYYKITGSTPKEQRLQMVKDFNEDDTPVFLISLKAGGTGLNLTGADIVIHYDPWWNVAAMNQASDRAHRIGQTRKVTVYKLIVKDTIEEKIMELQEAKKNLAEEVLSGQASGITAMTKEQLLSLF